MLMPERDGIQVGAPIIASNMLQRKSMTRHPELFHTVVDHAPYKTHYDAPPTSR